MLDEFVDDSRAVLGVLKLDLSNCGSRTSWRAPWSAQHPWPSCAAFPSTCSRTAPPPRSNATNSACSGSCIGAGCRCRPAREGAMLVVSSRLDAGVG